VNIRDVDDSQVTALKPAIYKTKPHVRVGSARYPNSDAQIVAIRIATKGRPIIPELDPTVLHTMFSNICGVAGFFRENSGFKFVPDLEVPEWVSLGNALSAYADPESGPEFKRDVLKAANVDWALIDTNHDGKITNKEAVLVFLISNPTPQNNDMASTRRPAIGAVTTPSGTWDFGSEAVVNYTVNKPQGSAKALPAFFRNSGSSMAHELLHAWFDLVDRYNGWAGLQDIMASDTSWKHATLYDKMMIGWVSPKFVTPSTANRVFTFDTQGKKPEGLVLIDPSRPKEYWIFERRPVYSNCGFESGLPTPPDGFAVYWVKRQVFVTDDWKGNDDVRLVDAALPDQDPDGSGPVQMNGSVPAPVASPGPKPGYGTPSAGAFFRPSQQIRRLYYGDGTPSPFSFVVTAKNQVSIRSP
jgi:M6 family metalloprotease-like protein